MLSYSTLRDLFKAKVKQLGYPAECFSLHSLRAGGASAAANLMYQTVCLNGMADGNQKMPRTDVLRTLYKDPFR